MSDKRRAERKPLVTEIEFHSTKDLIDAKSVDISETGIKFITDDPLSIRMRFKKDGKLKEKFARLVWSKNKENGQTEYGFEFFECNDHYSIKDIGI
jgi:hypothetical protein